MKVLAITAQSDAVAALHSEPRVTELVIESSLARGLALVRERQWGLVLLDSAVHEEAATEILTCVVSCQTRVVLLARDWSLEAMIAALGRGAADVLPFPPNAATLREALARCVLVRARSHTDAPSRPVSSPFVAESLPMVNVLRTVARVARTSATVLIQGESGTGKECVARLLHEHSVRRTGSFIAVNCAAIPEPLLETELFGCERGAYTGAVARRIGKFERATGGTLFLDEIGDMSLSLQAKILRALQEREVERVGGERPVRVDLRVIAATNCDLRSAVAAGRFREDLYFRLAVVELAMPPLRARGEDILALADYLIAYFAAEHGRAVRGIADAAVELLRRYDWPGNVRELRNVLERAVLLADGPAILPVHLELSGVRAGGGRRETGALERFTDERPASERVQPLDDVVREHIMRTLAATGGRQAQAADLLGIHRNTLRRKLQEYGVSDEHDGPTDADGAVDAPKPLRTFRENAREGALHLASSRVGAALLGLSVSMVIPTIMRSLG